MVLAFLGFKPAFKTTISANGQECYVVDSEHTVLKKPGAYCLEEDLVITKPSKAIVISASNITLDLNGYTIRYEGEMSSGVVAIQSNGHNHVTITNGAIEGFYIGIRASGNNLSFRNLHIHDIRFMGMLVTEGEHITIEDNLVEDVSRKERMSDSEGAYATGIQLRGNDVIVINNTIKNIYPLVSDDSKTVGEGVGLLISVGSENIHIHHNHFLAEKDSNLSEIAIWLAKNTTAEINDNHITNHARAYTGMGNAVVYKNILHIDEEFYVKGKETSGIWIGGDAEAIVKENTILNYQTGIAYMGNLLEAEQNHIRINSTVDTIDVPTYGVWLARGCVYAIVRSNDIINYHSSIDIRNKEREHLFVIENNTIE